MKYKFKNNKGFTLVELIVVLVILAILAAILVPTLLGYVDRAKREKNVGKMHDLQVAASSALAEYYGFYKDNPDYKFNFKKYKTPSGDEVKAYNITNYSFARAQLSNDAGNSGSDVIVKAMLRYLDSSHGDSSKDYTFEKNNTSPYGKTATQLSQKGAEGIIMLFSSDCKLLLLQYSDLDGYLYTYEPKLDTINVEKNGRFILDGVKTS